MKVKRFRPVARGITAVMASLLAISGLGYGVADKYRGALDNTLGTQSYQINEDKDASRFKSDYATIDDLADAARALAVREGEEGTVVMKNDNSALPLASGKKVALFGTASYLQYKGMNDLHADNSDMIDLVGAFEKANIALEPTVKAIYDKILSHTVTDTVDWGSSTQTTVTVTYGPTTTLGDMEDFKINEVPESKLVELGEAAADWKSAVVKNDTIGICTFSRPGGENCMYAPNSAVNFEGVKTGKDPLALSDDELSIVDLAKETCSKVIVLLNTGNQMELGDIVKGGAHEVDAICYIGIPNDYQCEGIVNVLSGKVNATGALADTFVYSNSSIPAMMNAGGKQYGEDRYFNDYQIVEARSGQWDDRYPNTEIRNGELNSFDRAVTYNGGMYIVEAEGIYVGYKYYETRYYDSVVDAAGTKANSVKGSTRGSAWDYAKEVTYTFGHGLSYLDYDQNIENVVVDKQPEGNITATVAVHNKSNTDGKFLAQLYVQQPYTQYDKDNGVEKSAVMFLNSKKVDVKAGATERVEITIPTKYLASYDYKNAKTYILDDGTYYFTAAAGSHEAVNNILTRQGYTGDAAGNGAVSTWSLGSRDTTTYAVDNGTVVTNVADNADLNYWLPDTVTYLSRRDWDATYPINYNTEKTINIGDSAKKDEWIDEIRGRQYKIKSGTEAKNVNGSDDGLRFNVEQIGYEQLSDINNVYWQSLVDQISVDQAVGGVLHGGSQTDIYTNVDNPIVSQNEGVNGYTSAYRPKEGEEAKRDSYKFNIHSQTLIATSFNEELAWEWGVIEGESGLWLQRFDVWGTGLTQRRTPYNGRNDEYISEDPMLANRIGYGIIGGAKSKGTMCGPKHLGFNDQEHNRAGLNEFMNEQKIRETDLRCFQGGLDDAEGLAVMIAFNRIGSTNASHHAGILQNILRKEWGFKGLISTDMMSNAYYFAGESMVMAGITQVADFSQNDNTISGSSGHDSNWSYISVNSVRNDAEFVAQARENLKYQFYAFANSGVMNISTVRVTPWWEALIKTVIGVSAGLTAAGAICWTVTYVLGKKEED